MAFRAGGELLIKKAQARMRRIPAKVRGRVADATEANAKSLLRDIEQGVPIGRTRALRRSPRAASLPGSAGTTWRTTSGDSDAFYAHMVDGGTKPGRRQIKRGPRRGQSFDHPGTRAVGFHRARARLRRPEYRKRMRLAYRTGVRGR